ncbi:hypothetical protein [Vibrio mediterranei]|uniref:hypothetical protein n=1 Tax=Vibrio mediterranei TaxID=689 RepID=UPI00406931A8
MWWKKLIVDNMMNLVDEDIGINVYDHFDKTEMFEGILLALKKANVTFAPLLTEYIKHSITQFEDVCLDFDERWQIYSTLVLSPGAPMIMKLMNTILTNIEALCGYHIVVWSKFASTAILNDVKRDIFEPLKTNIPARAISEAIVCDSFAPRIQWLRSNVLVNDSSHIDSLDRYLDDLKLSKLDNHEHYATQSCRDVGKRVREIWLEHSSGNDSFNETMDSHWGHHKLLSMLSPIR